VIPNFLSATPDAALRFLTDSAVNRMLWEERMHGTVAWQVLSFDIQFNKGVPMVWKYRHGAGASPVPKLCQNPIFSCHWG
jgi:hypothetical protein